jgi:endogenous inhibitor of DNA gyrase (YacG/DUF329 family)
VKARCPGCGKPADTGPDNPWRPFCSERCKLADLGQWFSGRYSLTADDETDPPPEDKSRQ